MTLQTDTSVIVVSHSRPVELQQMLACLRFQDVAGFEVIVVTNTPDAPDLTPDNLTVLPFHHANIAAARNAGIAVAKGTLIAFCDDDALPDPCWLRRLLAPFADAKIGGAGGYTRGRNGISLQWGAVETDLNGSASPVGHMDRNRVRIFTPDKSAAPVMIGTNCAFRAAALAQIGGFDRAFAYYLDDSDISLRLSKAGWKLAIVPDAQVHHGFAAGPHRTHRRIPTSLETIGQSKAYFCRKHAPAQDNSEVLEQFYRDHKIRLDKAFLLGLLTAAESKRLLSTLRRGFERGGELPITAMDMPERPASPVAPVLAAKNQTHIVLAGRSRDKEWLAQTAAQLSALGVMVTTLCLSFSAMFMQVRFSGKGYWAHRGGRFGKACRDGPLFRWCGFEKRAIQETNRLSEFRPVEWLVYAPNGDGPASIPPQIPDIELLRGCVVKDLKS